MPTLPKKARKRMASLVELLFETMPLAAVRHELTAEETIPVDLVTVGQLRDLLGSYPLDALSGLRHDCPPISGDYLAPPLSLGLDLNSQLKRRSELDAKKLPLSLWSFDASKSLTTLHNLDARTEAESYRNMRVLESVSFGIERGDSFLPELDVVVEGRRMTLPLGDAAHFATLVTRGGTTGPACRSMWTTPLNCDWGIMHVYVYDIDPVSSVVIPAQDIVDPQLEHARRSLDKLATGTTAEAETRSDDPMTDLFRDNAWTLPTSTVIASVLEELRPGGAPSVPCPPVDIFAVPRRVLVCTFVNLSKVGDDYTPGRPAWGVRAHPVIMVRSTHPMDSVVGGVKLVRPRATTIEGVEGESCACSEMKATIGSMLVADANNGDPGVIDVVPGEGKIPVPLWDELFAYSVVDASRASGGKRIKVVDASKGSKRILHRMVSRRGKVGAVTRLPRQGAFDNIHMAPPMRMPKVDRVQVGLQSWALTDQDRAAWHFDDVAMAPICAHDCFHLHWRWSDATVSESDRTALGFVYSGGKGSEPIPYIKRGAPLIPPNQDLFIRLPDQRTLVYEASAYDAKADRWQVICHHGVGYVTYTGLAVDLGRAGQDAMALPEGATQLVDVAGSVPVGIPRFFSEGVELFALLHWAVFYWRNRFYVPGYLASPQERAKLVDLSYMFNEPSPPPPSVPYYPEIPIPSGAGAR
jgi:hypothetical protein